MGLVLLLACVARIAIAKTSVVASFAVAVCSLPQPLDTMVYNDYAKQRILSLHWRGYKVSAIVEYLVLEDDTMYIARCSPLPEALCAVQDHSQETRIRPATKADTCSAETDRRHHAAR